MLYLVVMWMSEWYSGSFYVFTDILKGFSCLLFVIRCV